MTSHRGFTLPRKHEEDDAEDDNKDDDSDTLTEIPFSRSPASSLGRSSTGSIPWAEDAVKQNQLEWERIEKIFYGEEDLPLDCKLREEFLEWMSSFPHLRINGCALPIQESPLAKSTDSFYEEIYSIDPPLHMSRIRSSRSGKAAKQIRECEFQFVPSDIERYLHISSGQILRNNHRNAKDLIKNSSDATIPFVDTVEKAPRQRQLHNNLIIPATNQSFGILINTNYSYLTGSEHVASSRNSSAQSVARFNNSIMHKKLAPLSQRPQPKLSTVQLQKPIISSSASATNARIPPLSSGIKFIENSNEVLSLASENNQRHAKLNMIKSATSSRYPLSPTKNIITLPSLSALNNSERTGTIPRGPRKIVTSFNSEIVGRSISAAVLQKNLPSKHAGTNNSQNNAHKLNVINHN